jgi:hypothetical protein
MLLNCAVVFQDDPSWKKVLEPLLSIERVCMSTVVCVEQVRRGEKGQKKKTGEIGNDDDDDDDEMTTTTTTTTTIITRKPNEEYPSR